jgi:RimJ/RimL family protein N-acetyltransferase
MSNSEIIIRNLNVLDNVAYLDFAFNIINENIYSISSRSEFDYSPEEEKEWIERMLLNKHNICIVALYENRIIANLNIIQNNFRKMSHVAELIINIDKEFRGQGLGGKILSLALKSAHKDPCIKIITLEVIETNRRAINLYKKFGFVVDGIHKDFIRQNDEYVNLLSMSLNLED